MEYIMNSIVEQIMQLEHFTKLTPIQQAVIDRKDKKRDLIGISSTGSGKSHAFFMAIFEQIDPNLDCVQAMISTPTRELAFQLYERCKVIAKHFGITVKLITGGMEKKETNQAQIIIGTPGRMQDLFLSENTLRLDTAKMVIIDEADMTLEFGFLEDIDKILSKMDKKVQVMVYSATIPEALKPFLKKYLNDPIWIKIEDSQHFQSDIHHVLVPCKHKTYEEKLLDVLSGINPYVCLIFANTNKEASVIAQFLRDHGLDLIELHGDLESRQRIQAIKRIQSMKYKYIVASDIASRGIDLEGVTHVISCGFPKDLTFYVHRSGRTGRADRDGMCIALYKEDDANAIKSLQSKGIVFDHKDIRNGSMIDLRPYGIKRRVHKNDPLEKEISKVVNRKAKKVKPNYKKKQKEEIERLKRKRKREIIQKDIQRQKKERAKERQRMKRQGQ